MKAAGHKTGVPRSQRTHGALSLQSALAFQKVARLIPREIPVIL